MKKLFLLPLAALALTACTSDEYTGTDLTGGVKTNEIAFAGGASGMLKGDHVAGDAAGLLDKNFVVEGVKGNGTTQTVVFDHYNVNYEAGTANTTESNTADWEYVAQRLHPLTDAKAQTIKYWDYATSQYDFVAFSYGKATDKSNTSDPVFSKVSYTNIGKAVSTGTPVYTVLGNAAELAKTYIADLVTVYNRDGVSEYGTTVTPRFRSMGTKVRVAFYETVPGYSVKNLKFYSEAWDGNETSAAGAANATLFAENAIFPSASTAGTMSVYYPTVGWAKSGNDTDPKDADYNQAHIEFTAGTGTQALATTKTFGAINYTTYTENTLSITDALGKTSNTASYAGDGTNNNYQVVLPLGTSDNLQIRVEYDLVSTDGAAETIHVRDARAVVPAAYADWKPNYAYTYIFKISDNTNGWTGVNGDGDVVEGLTPITFDAVVVDTEDGLQETITTVATPSITTYQKGKNVSSYNEYKAGNIYSAVMNSDATAVTLTTTNCCYYEVTAGAAIANEAIIADMLNGTKSNTGITLSPKGATILDAIPGADTADGNDLTVTGKVAKLDIYAGKTYVFRYSDATKNYVKVIRVQ